MDQSIPKQTILVVDDTPENIDVLGEILGKDYKIKFATNGEKALKIARAEDHPDLILLDIEMPGIDGYEVCEIMRLNPDYRDVKIVFFTAKGRETEIAKGLALGADAYITKPYSNAELVAKIKDLLETTPKESRDKF